MTWPLFGPLLRDITSDGQTDGLPSATATRQRTMRVTMRAMRVTSALLVTLLSGGADAFEPLSVRPSPSPRRVGPTTTTTTTTTTRRPHGHAASAALPPGGSRAQLSHTWRAVQRDDHSDNDGADDELAEVEMYDEILRVRSIRELGLKAGGGLLGAAVLVADSSFEFTHVKLAAVAAAAGAAGVAAWSFQVSSVV